MAVPGNLTTLIKRLEAATSRLEDLTTASMGQNVVQAGQQSSQGGSSGVNYTSSAPPGSGATVKASDAPSLSAFEDLVNGPLKGFVEGAQPIGGVVQQQAGNVDKLFKAQLDFLRTTVQCKKPTDPSQLGPLLGPTQNALALVQEVRDNDRARRFDNHLKMVSEGIQALGWVTIEPKPGPFVKDMKDAADFYGNRVIKEHKDSNQSHVAYVRAFGTLLEELRKYIMQWHTTGISWNPTGQDISTFKRSAAPPPPAAPAAPSAPPPPSPAAPLAASAGSAGGMDAVFAQLNQGGSVTSGLKKVDDSQKTHKNPNLRDAAAIPSTGAKPPTKPPKPGQVQKKPPKTELDGNKWTVENHEGNSAIVLNDTALNHVVHIFNCKSSTLQIKGKINAISMANCKKTNILLDSAVSSLGVTNSPGFQVQITGKVPTITIDSTDGGQVYLSKSSMDTEIITSKSSSLNISLPVEGEEEGVFSEKPVPEQLKTVVQDGKLITTVVEHAG